MIRALNRTGDRAGTKSRFFGLTPKRQFALYRRVYGETNDKKRAN
jgi:hypothetical protein